MIVPMSEIRIFIAQAYVRQAVAKLRELGVVHIKHLNEHHNEGLTAAMQRISETEKAIGYLPQANIENIDDCTDQHCRDFIKDTLSLVKTRQELLEQNEELKEKLAWFDIWGDVSASRVHELEKEGVYLKLYTADRTYLKKIPEDKLVYVINKKGAVYYFAFITTLADERLQCKEISVPAKDWQFVNKKYSENKKHLGEIDTKLAKLSEHKNKLIGYKNGLSKKLEFNKACLFMADRDGISYLGGYCPKDRVKEIARLSQNEGWGYMAEEPENKEETPTLLKNPLLVRAINPVLKFMDILPGYNETDISFWFLLSFCLFFSILIGDAGYGLLFLILTLSARKKLNKAPREPFILLYFSSILTIIWGAITGTWFGSEYIANLPIPKALIIPSLYSFTEMSQITVMQLCLIIGAVHLTIAHGIKIISQIRSVSALGELGWLGILWGMFFLAGNFVISKPLPNLTVPFLVVGTILAIVFSNPKKNILMMIITNIMDFPLKAIGFFADIVSYLRLFAVGYASCAIATSFNNLAIGSGVNNIMQGIFAAMIIFLGHSLNIILGSLAIIVHGVRLNIMEFSGHLGLGWTGIEYKPFKE